MKNNLTNKIIEFFNEQNCFVKSIFRNLELNSEYYVIYCGQEDIMLNDFAYYRLIDFRKDNSINVLGFYEKNIESEKRLSEEFLADGYERIYNKD